MKKILLLPLVLSVLMICGGNISAEETGAPSAAEELGIDLGAMTDSVPQEAEEFIAERGLTAENTDEMLKITPLDVLGYVWDSFAANLQSPLKTLTLLLAVVLLGSVVGGLGGAAANKQLTEVYGIISVLVSVGVVTKPVTECISRAADTLTSGGYFMLSYIPVFAGIAASAGNVSAAVAYNMLVVLVAESAVQLSSGLIMPALSVCMALGVVEAVNPNFSLTGITKAIKKASTFMLGFMMTIFIGLLSIQSIVGSSADTLGIKAAKFMASNFIPVIGGAVADAYTAVRSSIGLLKSGVGFFGVAVIFVTVLPPLTQVIAMRLIFSAGEILADMFGAPRLKVLFKNTADILSLMFSLLVCFTVMFVLSTAILMMTGLNIG